MEKQPCAAKIRYGSSESARILHKICIYFTVKSFSKYSTSPFWPYTRAIRHEAQWLHIEWKPDESKPNRWRSCFVDTVHLTGLKREVRPTRKLIFNPTVRWLTALHIYATMALTNQPYQTCGSSLRRKKRYLKQSRPRLCGHTSKSRGWRLLFKLFSFWVFWPVPTVSVLADVNPEEVCHHSSPE